MKKIWRVVKQDPKTKARVGWLETRQGRVVTPCFIPDATYGAVKHLSAQELKEIGLQMVLGNVYHLGIRPGVEVIKKLGGLRKFMAWEGPILTDSGGFQAFSLVHRRGMGKISEEGIVFRDHLGGKEHFLTPEKSIQMQLDLESDILMVLDYPVLPDVPESVNRHSVSLTTKWAQRSREYFMKRFSPTRTSADKILMAIIQGANSQTLRKRSFVELEEVGPFVGYGFGGPPVNQEILTYTAALIPNDRIRYLMGGGTPWEIVKAVAMGWDLFDCVIPTRNARHGLAYFFQDEEQLKMAELRIWQEQYRWDQRPIEENCPCLACRDYSRAYLRHLLKVKEPLGQRLMTLHNLSFYLRLMKRIREMINEERFQVFWE